MYRYREIALLLLGSFILSVMTGGFADAAQQSQPTVNRAEAITSNLPIVIIDTLGQWIPDDPKIPARMKIIYDKSGGRNALESRHVDFEGRIAIEVRGKTSQMFPKQQYGFEIQDDAGNDKDVSLLQLPAESEKRVGDFSTF